MEIIRWVSLIILWCCIVANWVLFYIGFKRIKRQDDLLKQTEEVYLEMVTLREHYFDRLKELGEA